MRQPMLFGVLAGLAAASAASGEEFPLEFKTIDVQQAQALPGNSGSSVALALTKPAALKNEPKAVSAHPAYALPRAGETDGLGLLLRIDESKGDGKGYDQLIVDINENGDLTDDPVLTPVVLTGPQPRYPEGYELATFGPIQAPADKAIGGKRPVCYAQMVFYRKGLTAATTATAAGTPQRTYVGSMRLYSAWYLEAAVNVNGIKQKLGVVDGNANFRLGDVSKARTIKVAATNQENLYFTGGDNWLRDFDNSGKFENKAFGLEYQPFGSIMYFGAVPCRVTLKPDCKAVAVEAWSGPLGEVALQTQGATVRGVSLAWEEPAGQWQLIQANVTDGKVRVPAGNHRLYSCEIVGTGADGQPLAATAYQRAVKEPLRVAANQTTKINCGGPLTAKLTTAKTAARPGDVILQAALLGVAGEQFSNFGTGKNFAAKPTPPTFAITTKDGKQIASGNMEYG